MKLARIGRSLVVSAMTLLLVTSLSGAAAAADPAATRDAPDGRAWIVLLRPAAGDGSTGATADQRSANRRPSPALSRARARAADLTIDQLETSLGFSAGLRYHWAVQGFAAVLSRLQVAQLRLDPSVSLVVPDAPAAPAGPGRQPVGIDVARVNAAPPSAGAAADANVDVAVIDTGIGSAADATLGGELDVIESSSSTDRDSTSVSCLPAHPGDTSDGYGHGTHVSGTIAARDNAVGTVGVAPGARLHAVRVFDSQAQGSTSTVICGIDWATHWKAVVHPTKPLVANMSLRGFDTYRGHSACDDPGGDPDPEHRAICAGVAAGVVFVVAAGNESDDAASYIPSRYPQVITVSALSDFDGSPGALGSQADVAGCVPPSGPEKDDAFARYSNYGAVVDIIAPGTCVRSTAIGSGGTLASKLMSGTSMATPHVTGAVALYLAMHPSTTPDGMRQLLLSSGDLDWNVTSDPDGHPDRLLDVAALLGSSDGLAAWASPARVVVPADATQRTFSVLLQRRGGFAGSVSIDATGLPAAVGTISLPPGSLDGMAAVEATATLDVADDAPDGDYPVTITASGPGGTPSATTHLTVHVDGTLPVVAAPWPGILLRSGGTFDGSALVRLTWSASDAAPGAVAHLELQRRNGPSGTWTRVAYGGPSLLSSDAALTTGADARFRVRATDDAGNIGTSSVLVSGLRLRESNDPAIGWSTGWTTHPRGTASGHSLRTSSLAGATADLAFSGRGVAWVAPLGSGKGSARVAIDGQVVATIHLSSTQSHPRHIVFASSQLAAGAHTLRIEVLSGIVDLDALLMLR